MARHARRVLQERAAKGVEGDTLAIAANAIRPKTAILKQEDQSLEKAVRLRCLWTLQVLGKLDSGMALKNGLSQDSDEYVRAWTIQLLCEDKKVPGGILKEFVRLAREDKSPVVRLYLAAAMQRLPIDDRWEVIEALAQHAEDANDHNLPLMVWYAGEPLPTKDFNRALKLAENAKLPKILEFMVRRTGALNNPEAFAAIADCEGDGVSR